MPTPKERTLFAPVTKEEILLAAKAHPEKWIKICRYDREEGKYVEDIITADMPWEEIIL
jgi:hypothetical protein